VALDGRVLAVTAGVSVITAILFGLLPARRAARPNLVATLRDGERGSTGGRRSQRMRGALVASEVALSVLLLVGAGLMIRSFAALRAVDPGFVPDHLLSLVMSVTGSAEAEPGRRTAFYQDVVARVAALPGVEAASAINHVPLAGDIWGFPFVIEGRPTPKPGETPVAIYRITLPGYFKAMQLPLIRGRDFTDDDTLGRPGVMIVNEYLARTHFPGEDAIGRRVRLDSDSFTIVGIAKDAVRGDWASPPEEEVYVAYLQNRAHRESLDAQRAYMTLVVRASGDPAALVPAVRSEIRAVAPDVAISEVLALRDVVSQATDGTRFVLVLLGVFAGVALILAAVGIYGVMSFVVSGRRHEIGIRMALGATPAQVLANVVRDGMTMALVGAAAGVAGVYLLAKASAGLVYGVSPTDASTIALSALCLIAVALAACYLPARRASRVDPLQEIR
jgi:putative ABC transport system permease protein